MFALLPDPETGGYPVAVPVARAVVRLLAFDGAYASAGAIKKIRRALADANARDDSVTLVCLTAEERQAANTALEWFDSTVRFG